MSILAQNNIIETPFTNPFSEKELFDIRQSEYEELSDFLQQYKILIDEETNFYIIEREKENEGMYELWGTTKEEINRTLRVNKFWEIKEREHKKEREENRNRYENRFRIPAGKTKKEYKELFKETTDIIKELDDKWKKESDDFRKEILDEEINHYVEKRRKLKSVMVMDNKNFGSEITRAKAHPIETIIEFNNAGFASCPFHGPEKTPSFKLYKNRNKAHCFSCGKDADTIDIYMIINNCSLSEAVKNLK